jgi:phosphoribosylaminoimidazole-succinocarboxamide synthase
MEALLKTDYPGLSCRRGKVRDLYDLGDRLVMIATDRISAFDWVMPNPIPGKGRILTEMSLFWFSFLGVGEQLITSDPLQMGVPFSAHAGQLAGRSMLVKKTEVIPFECVVRGYLAGSAWKEYRETGTVAGIRLPNGLKQAAKLPVPIFTPATKAETGHDINITFEELSRAVGQSLANELQKRSLDIYNRAFSHALSRGLILADTKFEFGRLGEDVLLIDEILTPDSSRYWSAKEYREGISPPSFDKQFMRDWLESTGWDKQSAPPLLPPEIVAKTLQRYQQARDLVLG